MKKNAYSFSKVLRFLCLTGVMLLGFITIIGTSGDDEKTSVSDTRERGIYKFVVTEVDGGDFDYYINTRKLDMESAEELVEKKTEYFDSFDTVTKEDDKILKEVTDDDGDGSDDYENQFDYNVNGDIEEARYGYYDGSGILQISNIIVYTYYNGEQGDNLNKKELDEDYDGTFKADAAYQYTYVEHGDKWDIEKTTYDSNGDTETDNTYTYEYGSSPTYYLLFAKYWLGDDGLDKQISEVSYFYDGDGNLHMSETDFNLDGDTDYTFVYYYDEFGNKLSDEVYWGDVDTGYLFSGIYYNYDENGNIVKEETDENGNGEIDSVIDRDYDDPKGRITSELTDYNNDDEIDLTYTWEYIDPVP